MLFIGHTGATAVNLGKVLFTRNPVSINFPQWIAFAKYSYSQLKWALIEKPSLQSAYVDGKLSEEFDKVYAEIDSTFSEFVEENVIVFN